VKYRKTQRGFELVEFSDTHGDKCSIQESSACTVEGDDNGQGFLWIGIDDPQPKILATVAQRLGLPIPPGEVSGWVPYPIHDDVLISTRMHLNEPQVRALVEKLTAWLESGSLK